MAKYIALLRGINVGGNRKILMADLKALLATLGYTNVTTYIQSGNVVFETAKKRKADKLAAEIAKAILDEYGFVVPVIICTPEEIAHITTSNPFEKPEVDIKRLHVTFLAEPPTTSDLEAMNKMDFSPDQLVIDQRYVFICYASTKYSDSKLSNQVFEKKLKVAASTRNWKTIKKLSEMI